MLGRLQACNGGGLVHLFQEGDMHPNLCSKVESLPYLYEDINILGMIELVSELISS